MRPASFLRSTRLEYRHPELADVARMVGWINDPEVRRHLDQRVFPLGQQAEEEWVRGLPARVAARTDVVLLVLRQSDGEPVGSTGFHAMNWLARWAEFGILLGREHWNQGYGPEVTSTMLRYAFQELHLDAVRLRVNASHQRARRAYVHAGFVEEGVLRRASWVDGAYDDIVVMSVLKDEWRPDEGG